MTIQKNATFERFHKRAALAVIATALILSGCRDRLSPQEAVYLSDPSRRHEIRLANRVEAIDLQLAHPGARLTSRHQIAVREFAAEFRKAGTGQFMVILPARPGSHFALRPALQDVRRELEMAGFGPDDVRVRRTGLSDDRGAVIRLAYSRRVAIAPNCGKWPADVGRNREALPYHNFGCATQRNLANNVRYSRDLERPQVETSSSGERRRTTWREYVGGTDKGSGDDAGKTGTTTNAGSP